MYFNFFILNEQCQFHYKSDTFLRNRHKLHSQTPQGVGNSYITLKKPSHVGLGKVNANAIEAKHCPVGRGCFYAPFQCWRDHIGRRGLFIAPLGC